MMIKFHIPNCKFRLEQIQIIKVLLTFPIIASSLSQKISLNGINIYFNPI